MSVRDVLFRSIFIKFLLLCCSIMPAIGQCDTYKHTWTKGTPDAIEDAAKAVKDISAFDSVGWFPLMWAAEQNKADSVRKLIECGADPKTRTLLNQTPLMLAAKSNTDTDVILTLVEAGAELDAQDNEKRTALMYAARNNDLDQSHALTALLKSKANPSLRDKNGNSALDYAKNNLRLRGTHGLELLTAYSDPAKGLYPPSKSPAPLSKENEKPKIIPKIQNDTTFERPKEIITTDANSSSKAAVITAVAIIIAAFIGAFATIKAARLKQKDTKNKFQPPNERKRGK